MKIKTNLLGLLIMLVIILIWVVVLPLSKDLPTDTFKDPVGAAYNGLNVLFTALAFGGVVISLLFQIEQSKSAQREEIERSIFELFQTFTTPEFQNVKDSSYRALLVAIKNHEYATFLASRLFVVDQLHLPPSALTTIRSLDAKKASLADEQIEGADRDDRLMLDNMLNFFALLAQRKSSATVIKHCDFAYDWWRPALWIIAQLQYERYQQSENIRKYCKNQLVIETLKVLDKIYGHTPLHDNMEVWKYITQHPKMVQFGLDPTYMQRAK